MSQTVFWEPGDNIHRGRRSLLHRLLVDCGRETRDGIASMAGVAVAGRKNRRSLCRGSRSLTKGKTGFTAGKGGSISHGKQETSRARRHLYR
jgi:hypothetical protein